LVNEDEHNGYLSTARARATYDRIGRLQDWQSFYEASAIRDLIAHGQFESSRAVFEFGCGTGSFAVSLLQQRLPSDARYVGFDLSPKMVRLAKSRLTKWSDRAEVWLSSGSPELPAPTAAFDRFVSNYVFDLLAPDYARGVLAESTRVLSDGGLLCLVSLSSGTSRSGQLISSMCEAIWRWSPAFVGGCRPQRLEELLPADDWTPVHNRLVSSFGITSQVVVARRSPTS
jgi:ubiquinone/menaquinone biosynthesis C-methylase UbiE